MTTVPMTPRSKTLKKPWWDRVKAQDAQRRHQMASRAKEPEDWRGARLIGVDLSGRDLSGKDFTGAELSGANFSGARLIGANFTDATLFEADLTGAELLSANFQGANLDQCKASKAGLGGADLRGATLFGADLSFASLSQAQLNGANLSAANLTGARLRGAWLNDAVFKGANLTGADLEGCCVQGADMRGVKLEGAAVRGMRGYTDATWLGASIVGVDFCGAYMLRRFIMDENYLDEFRRHSRMSAIVYKIWWATSDCGRSFVRWALWTALLAVVFAAIYSVVAIDPGDHGTALTPLYFSVVTLTTLGYGDVLPASATAQCVAVVQVCLGYFMLGGLLSIFANKMARRAD